MAGAGGVLIIEDDLDVQRAARIALSTHFERIDALPSPVPELDSRLDDDRYEAVLLDMNFVAGDRSGAVGLDALSRIQACDACLSVVLMTAYGGVALAVAALKRGATDFILKPWHNEKLIAAVGAAAQRTRERRATETQTLDTLERDAIERALARAGGNISLAAQALGISRPALYRRLSKYGL